jgi:hypothetical protein
MKKIIKYCLLVISVTMLSGCLYPEQNLQKNRVPYESQLQLVQTVVEQYQANNNGLLPIKDRDFNTPIYQKYPIDFQKIIPRYLQDAPGNSFENGGIYQYVLVDVEENPKVKLIDLVSVTTVQSIKMRLNAYLSEYEYPPYEKELSKGIYSLNYKSLGFKEPPYVVSPFSQNNLPVVINTKGELLIDYRQDIYQKIMDATNIAYKPGDDIRDILVEDSAFVPVFSVPYTINEKNEPIFLTK